MAISGVVIPSIELELWVLIITPILIESTVLYYGGAGCEGVRGRRADLKIETFYDSLAFSLANNVLLCYQRPSFCILMHEWLCTPCSTFLLSFASL